MPSIMPIGKQQYTNNAGVPLAGGKVYTFDAGTTTPKATYQDAAGTVENTNPIILNARGEALAFWDGAYSVKVTDANGVLIYTIDNYQAPLMSGDLSADNGAQKVGGTWHNGVKAPVSELGTDDGATLIGFKLSAIGSVTASVAQVLGERISLFRFLTDEQIADVKAYAYARNLTLPIAAAISFLATTGGGTLELPAGGYLTDPIDLRGYSNVAIVGANPTAFINYLPATVIKIGKAGEVGIQMSDRGLEVPVSVGKGIAIENLYLDCNHLAKNGFNMNLGVALRRVLVRNAVDDGIVLEGSTYPVLLDQVWAQYNGRHGLYVKAPNTTVFKVRDCEFGFNDQYGMYIEDGSTAIFDTVLCQSNKRGGVKIIQNNPASYTKPLFLERLTFINLYCEANGTYAPADPLYNGNYALEIFGFNRDGTTNVGKINDLTFVNCSLNKSAGGDYCVVQGTRNLVAIGTPFLLDALDPVYNGVSEYRTPGAARIDALLNLAQPTAGQIRFPVTQHPSTDPNTLDDYEEGTFPFALAQSGTAPIFTSAGLPPASFIKIGRLVTCFVNYEWTNQNGASGAYFVLATGLPYPIAAGYSTSAAIEVIGTAGTWSICPVGADRTCQLRHNSAATFATCGDLPAAGRLTGTFSYLTDE